MQGLLRVLEKTTDKTFSELFLQTTSGLDSGVCLIFEEVDGAVFLSSESEHDVVDEDAHQQAFFLDDFSLINHKLKSE
jgi:hypothetical protein